MWSSNNQSNVQMEQFLESFAREMKSEVNAARNEIKQAQTRHEAALAVVVDQCAALREEFEATRHELSRQLREVSIKVESVSEQATNTDREVVELFKRLDTLLSFHRLDNIVKNGPGSSVGGNSNSSFMNNSNPVNASFSYTAAGNNASKNSSISFLGGPVSSSAFSTPSPMKTQQQQPSSTPISLFGAKLAEQEKKERPAFFGSSAAKNNTSLNSTRSTSPPRNPTQQQQQPGTSGTWRPPWHSKSS